MLRRSKPTVVSVFSGYKPKKNPKINTIFCTPCKITENTQEVHLNKITNIIQEIHLNSSL